MDRIKNIPGEAKLTPKDKIVLDYILRNQMCIRDRSRNLRRKLPRTANGSQL